ncbi:MAG: hypothetical protein ACI956_001136, partial [Nonlabens sp.]
MNNNPSPFLKRLQEEPQSLLPIGYVALVLIGMVNEAIYYWQFGINIFEYSEVFDFLIAPFKKIEYLLILLAAFILSISAFSADRFLQTKYPNFHNTINMGMAKKSWFKTYRQVSFYLTFVIVLIIYGLQNSKMFKDRLIAQETSDLIVEFTTADQPTLSAKKIGANKSYLFLIDQKEVIHIVPTSVAVK